MHQHLLKTNKTWVLALTSIASASVALDALVVTTALATIRNDFQISMETLEWTVNAYNLTFAVLLLAGAALGDHFGRRRMFAIGLGVFAIASALCGMAQNASLLIAARALQGVGAALIMPLAMALLSMAFPPSERGKALGIFGSITGLALIAGPLVGGAIVTGFDWRWIFWINLPIAAVVIPLVLTRIEESRGSAGSFDTVGLVLVSASSFGLVWGLMRGNVAGWASYEVLSVFAAGAIGVVAFVTWEVKASVPMVPMRFFKSTSFAAGIVSSVLFYASMYGLLFFLPQFFQTAQGHGPLGAGIRMLPWTATLFVIAPIAGSLINRIGERALVVAGLTAQAVGMALIAGLVSPDVPFAHLLLPLVLAGSGVSLAIPAAQNAVLGSVKPTEMGKASGIFNSLRFLAATFGIAIVVGIFGHFGNTGTATAFNNGFVIVLSWSAMLSILAAIIGLWLPTRIAPEPIAGEPDRGQI